MKIGISSCLLGNKVRYDGSHKLDRCLIDSFGPSIEWVPVCPETECGLSVPRETLYITGEIDSPRLIEKYKGTDHTRRMLEWAGRKIEFLKGAGLCGFVFKSKSPSCGLRGDRTGIFAGIFIDSFPYLPSEDDNILHDPVQRGNFLKKAFMVNYTP